MSEANKAIVQRFFDEVFTGGNLDAIDELVAEDAIEHEGMPGIEATGAEGVKQITALFRSAFPDLTVQVLDLIAEGDRVAARTIFEGTHQGEFMEIPATGSRIHIEAIDIMRLEDGKLAEHWGVTDTLSMLQQLGVIPEE